MINMKNDWNGLGDDFDPENFDPTSVRFSDHKQRLKMRA